MNLIFNGKLLEDIDFLDLGKKLKEGKKIVERLEYELFVIDIIVIVVLLEDDKILYILFDEIYVEFNVRIRCKLFFILLNNFLLIYVLFLFKIIWVYKLKN